MSTQIPYKPKRTRKTPFVLIATMAIVGLSVVATPYAVAASQQNTSPVGDIVDRFFNWHENRDTNTQKAWDVLPPGFFQAFFNRDMPGTGNDETNPAIENIDTHFEDEEITISWETDERTRGVVYLSTENPLDINDEDTLKLSSWRLSTQHEVTSDDLEADTTYYTLIKATDRAGNETFSEEFSFTTEEDENGVPPIITAVDTEADEESIVFSWTTNEPATSAVYTATTSGFSIENANVDIETSNGYRTSHRLTIENLNSNTTYYHRIVSEDTAGNKTISEQYTVSTTNAD